jgi:YidC/Oxa1 family membrane protein insertase
MDRRVIWAIVLMMVIAIGPTFFIKRPPPGAAGRSDTTAFDSAPPALPAPAGLPSLPGDPGLEAPTGPGDTVYVSSPLYEYGIATRGGGIVRATMLKYQALNPADRGQSVQLIPAGSGVHQLALMVGSDTLSLADWRFTVTGRPGGAAASGPIQVAGDTVAVTLAASRGGVTVEMTYRFEATDYQVGVSGRVTGLGPVGGHLLADMGSGFRQTEADSAANLYEYGVVTKTDESKLVKFSSLDPGERQTLEGPFEWAAVKSKYFVAALLAVDSGAARISGATMTAPAAVAKVHHAATTFTMPVPAAGTFGYRLYLGPMEYPRLRTVGHDFYDINPYGWPGFRTMIRPIAVGARWLLVWMHENLHLSYGLVLIAFGVLIRIMLWPLNQKGMRASIRMQALQPEMQRIQDKHKDDPQALQRAVMELYKREGVNPFSGCWPLLLPWPILLALFFVLANTIELRGQPFLWLPDLSLKDPLFIIPVLMGLSMYGLNKVGMAGMPPTPQTKMMLYFLPVMMTVMFVNFASGLNLYYFIQNLVSIPQQWYLARERMKAQAQNPPPVVGKKK